MRIRSKTIGGLLCTLMLLLSSGEAAKLTEGLFDRPRPKEPDKRQKATAVPDNKGGLILVLPKDAATSPSRTFSLRELPESEAADIMRTIGGSISKVKSPKDALAKIGPHYPFEMRKRGEIGRAICLFEVSVKGEVSRIFKVGDGSDEFFQECVLALEQWRFPKQPAASYRVIEFVAQKE
jgi:hypothetical protein